MSFHGLGLLPTIPVPISSSVLQQDKASGIEFVDPTQKANIEAALQLGALQFLSQTSDTIEGQVGPGTPSAWVQSLYDGGFVVLASYTQPGKVIATKAPAVIVANARGGGYAILGTGDAGLDVVQQAQALATQGSSPSGGGTSTASAAAGAPGWLLPALGVAGGVAFLALVVAAARS